MTLFEKATKRQLRYASSRGELTTEQLWSIPLLATGKDAAFCLDVIAGTINTNIQAANITSFVKVKRKDLTEQLKLDVVKRIIEVKLAEAEAKELAAGNKDKREILVEALRQKELNEIGEKTADELKAEIAKLSES